MAPPTYQFTYLRRDMPIPCKAIKTAPTEKEALALLCTGSEKKDNLRLTRSNVAVQIKEVKEL